MQQEVNGSSYTIGSEMPTSGGSGEYGPAVIEAGEACDCTICPVCGGCLVDGTLKVAQLPDDDTPPSTFFDCGVCSCVPSVNSLAFEANPKANCIYEKLISGGILQDFISRFFGPTEPNHSYLGELNLTWTLGSTAETLPIGVANNNVGYSVEIRLNETTIISGSATNVALSMLHGALHTKLIAEVYDEVGTTDFKQLFARYNNWPMNIDQVQEKIMLDDYFEVLALGLKKFDETQGIYHSLDMYINAVRYDLIQEIYDVGGSQSEYDNGYQPIIVNSSKNCN